jgi:hypothetical protein
MATTSINPTTEQLTTQSLIYIRPIKLKIVASNLKPNTRVYSYFDDVGVDRFVNQEGKLAGEPVITDNDGKIVAYFNVPSKTFNTGTRNFLFSQNSGGSSVINGASDVYATTQFITSGVKDLYKVTNTNLDTNTVEPVRILEVIQETQSSSNIVRDPLAQSFFTYGVVDGCYITSIDLFFRTKDTSLPVWLEIREMVNGMPSGKLLTNYSMSTVSASSVLVSADASVPTNFKLDKMTYLSPEKDYCFVVLSNSDKFNIWTSKLGENSIETGALVFKQPYTGSLFKSENNITWTQEQFEDIKFVLNRADFNIGSGGDIKFPIVANTVTMSSKSFVTTTGSNLVYVKFPHVHGLDLNSKIDIWCDTAGTYNGIAGNVLNGSFLVSDVMSDHVVGFIVPTASANSSSSIDTGGLVKDIQVTSGGSGYSDITPPTIYINGSGSSATAEAVIKNGVIADILITSHGTGYFGTVTANIVGAPGAGATCVVNTESVFSVDTNRIYHNLIPTLTNITPQNTLIGATLSTTLGAFDGGSVIGYSAGKIYDINLNATNKFDNNEMLVSRSNESINLGGNSGNVLSLNLTSTNSNVSPVIDISSSSLIFNSNSINSVKNGETITSNNVLGHVTTISIVSGGAGYTVAPAVVLTGGNNSATATCTISGGVVDSISIVHAGTGYYTPPIVSFVGSHTTAATATCTISDYNSELGPSGGTSFSRYITKKQSLATVSTSIRLFVNAYSNIDSSFDVYIRTALLSSGVNHDTLNWQLINCDISRNKSESIDQFKDYEMYLDNIQDFDIFSLKFVLRSKTPWSPPKINSYRAIIHTS